MRLVGVLLTEVQLPAPGLGFEVQQALRLVVYCGLTGQLLRRRDWVQQEECVLERHPRHSILAWNSRWAARALACSLTLGSCGSQPPVWQWAALLRVARHNSSRYACKHCCHSNEHTYLPWCSEGWQLLFPEVTSHNLQTLEFTGAQCGGGLPCYHVARAACCHPFSAAALAGRRSGRPIPHNPSYASPLPPHMHIPPAPSTPRRHHFPLWLGSGDAGAGWGGASSDTAACRQTSGPAAASGLSAVAAGRPGRRLVLRSHQLLRQQAA